MTEAEAVKLAEEVYDKVQAASVLDDEGAACVQVLAAALLTASRPGEGWKAEAWIVECPPGHEHDELLFGCESDANDQAELFNDDFPEGESPYKPIPLYRAPASAVKGVGDE